MAFAVGCNHPFSARGPYTDNLIIYGILTNRSDTQYVRVYSTYDPPGVNPLVHTSDNAVRGAGVVVTDGADPFQFLEEGTPRLDKSRYTDDIVAYASYPFLIEAGNTYGLSVTTKDFGGVTATVIVPKRGKDTIPQFVYSEWRRQRRRKYRRVRLDPGTDLWCYDAVTPFLRRPRGEFVGRTSYGNAGRQSCLL